MRNNKRIARWLSLSGLVIAGGLQTSAFPLVIRVYDPAGGGDPAALKVAAASLVDDATEAGTGTVNGFSYEVDEGLLVPARFSKTGGAATYIWSSHTLQFESGFDFRAGPFAFGKKAEPKLAKEGSIANETPSVAWTTGFRSASLSATALRLEYELAKGDAITATLFDARGKTLANWAWRESDAGRHVKSLVVNQRVKTGQAFLRLKVGDTRMVRKVRVE